MTRTAQEITDEAVGHLQPGWVWPLPSGGDPDRKSVIEMALAPGCASLAQVETDAAALMDEIDPRTAVLFLTDFERVLGPDPCGREGTTLEERQRIAHQRWTAKGGQSIPYFTGVAANLGVAIQVEEFWPSKAGSMRAGRRLIPEGEQFVWRVKLTTDIHYNFRAGKNRAGQRLGWFQLSDVECTIRRFAPAHTHVVFSYILEN